MVEFIEVGVLVLWWIGIMVLGIAIIYRMVKHYKESSSLED